MYSKKGLQALEQSLQLHRGLIWSDPVTNTLAVKSISDVQNNDVHEQHQQINVWRVVASSHGVNYNYLVAELVQAALQTSLY